ncbi:uncharacterized protein LOC111713793 [Eurytemora carolleeae]|uniref:uncharacterized protein LOC111713793 n=1 Tax=Eurytemora carolleeae TaxID=1294199 RepID=UPI000C77EC7E|nr:uncharacterized protein LOC111713793 [Eurytemora carolleeae]|eukprot:XP_023344499.1 uncharacterized protein LOC111713793 [Eurytemora affinis]
MPKEKTPASIARALTLTSCCLVCGGASAAHTHYGAVCCYSCRAFFRRGITRTYACVRGDYGCQVNSITRTNCKRCRYERCLAVGMKPSLVDASVKKKGDAGDDEVLTQYQVPLGSNGKIDSSLLLQALEGRKKVVLELRPGEQEGVQDELAEMEETGIHISSGAQPVRQQTYYIFHPGSQTFEPVTIAEFSEAPIVEEVVESEEYQSRQEEITGELIQVEPDSSLDRSIAEQSQEEDISETGLEARPISEADDKTKADNRQRKADVKKARTEDGQMVERIPKAEKRKIKLDKDDSRLIGVEESSTEELRRMDAQESMIVGDDERIVGDEERIAPEAATGQQEEVAEVPRIAPGVQFDSRNEDHRIIHEYLRLQQERNSTNPRHSIEEVEDISTMHQFAQDFEHHTAEGIHGLQPVAGHQPVVLEEGQRLIMENGQRLVVENGQIIVENDEINEPLQEVPERKIDIEKLVDLCFEEEFRRKETEIFSTQRGEEITETIEIVEPQFYSSEPHRQLYHARQQVQELPRHIKPQVLGSKDRPRYIRPSSNHIPSIHIRSMVAEPRPSSVQDSSLRHHYSPSQRFISAAPWSAICKKPRLSPSSPTQHCPTPSSSTQPRPTVPSLPAQHCPTLAPAPTQSMPTLASTSIQPSASNQRPSVLLENHSSGSSGLRTAISVSGVSGLMNQRRPSLVPISSPNHIVPESQNIKISINTGSVLLNTRPESSKSANEISISTKNIISPLNAVMAAVHGEENVKTSATGRSIVTKESVVPLNQVSVIVSKSPSLPPFPAASLKKRSRSQEREKTSTELRKRQRLSNPIIQVNKFKIPYLGFTLEEDFMIAEIYEGCKFFLSACYKRLLESQPVLGTKFLRDMVVPRGCKVVYDEHAYHHLRESFKATYFGMSSILFPSSIGKLSNGFLANVFKYSYPALEALEYGIYFSYSDCGNLLEQESKTCLLNSDIEKIICDSVPEFRDAESKSMQDFDILTSPWCSKQEDEEFFINTITQIGQILKNDQKLRCLVFLLIAVSQTQESPLAKNKNIRTLNTSLAQLLYRYLQKEEARSPSTSSQSFTDKFTIILSLISKLHTCGDIFMNRRIKTLPDLAPGLTQDSLALTQNSSVLTEDGLALTQDTSVLTQDTSVLTQHTSVLTQDT